MTVTHYDGTVEKLPAYTAAQLRSIDRKAARTPRAWDEVNSSKGGGRDFGPRR